VPWLVEVIRWAGAAFLVVYGLLAARRAIRPSGEALVAAEAGADAAGSAGAGAGTLAVSGGRAASGTGNGTGIVTATRVARSTTLLAAVLTCLALTWLNPHVYLDTVFLLGSVANTHGDGRWAFAVGAGAASIIWFFGLAYGARLLGGVLASPRAWRVLDGVIAVVMIALGVSLVLPH
jgi:L-lysine exporter family protein LysE/ArgO